MTIEEETVVWQNMHMIIPVSLSVEERERVTGDGGVLLCVVITTDVRGHLKEERGKTDECCSPGNRMRANCCYLNVHHGNTEARYNNL